MWGAIAQGALSLGGSIWSAQQSRRIADNNMDWQRTFSKTRYQREVEDLRKAGLNPMLAVQNGAQAGTSGTSMPNMELKMPDLVGMMMQYKQMQQTDAVTAKNVQETAESESRQRLNDQTSMLQEEQMRLLEVQQYAQKIQAQLGKLDAELRQHQITKTAYDTKKSQLIGNLFGTFANLLEDTQQKSGNTGARVADKVHEWNQYLKNKDQEFFNWLKKFQPKIDEWREGRK